jgi:acyl dehydratase
MPIDLEKALGARAEPVRARWRPNDVILYQLGLGAGRERPTDPAELRYTYEKNLAVLPTFAVVPGLRAVPDPNSLPGIDVDLTRLLHAEHEIRVLRPLAPSGEVTSTTRVAEVWDSGRDALVVLEIDSADPDGQLLFVNRLTMFLRGEGGFGGDPAPDTRVALPDRPPDAVLTAATHPAQALLYRLSGDPNPLHVDPAFAARAGFDEPILHGLCSYGVAGRALVAELGQGVAANVTSIAARFSSPVFPGETLTTLIWKTGPGKAVFRTQASGAEGSEAGRVVLDDGEVEYVAG